MSDVKFNSSRLKVEGRGNEDEFRVAVWGLFSLDNFMLVLIYNYLSVSV